MHAYEVCRCARTLERAQFPHLVVGTLPTFRPPACDACMSIDLARPVHAMFACVFFHRDRLQTQTFLCSAVAKVVMRRLLASRDLRRRQRRRDAAGRGIDSDEDLQGYDGEDDEDEDEELDPMTYRDSWTQTRPAEEPAERANDDGPLPPLAGLGLNAASSAYGSDFDADAYDYGTAGEENDEPYFEGVGSAGFSETDGPAARSGGRQQWERVSGRPRPRRRRRPVRSFEEGEAGSRRKWEGGKDSRSTLYGGESVDDSRLAAGRSADR